jgi:hypothetical protein
VTVRVVIVTVRRMAAASLISNPPKRIVTIKARTKANSKADAAR